MGAPNFPQKARRLGNLHMYAVKGWNEFQHYSKRNPPWVKLHRRFLDDYEFHTLPVASRALAPLLWLLASEHQNPKSGFIEGPDTKIAFRLHMSVPEFNDAIKPLIDQGFIVQGQDASKALANCPQDALPETEVETENRDRKQKQFFNTKNGAQHGKQKPTGGDEGRRIAEKILAEARTVEA